MFGKVAADVLGLSDIGQVIAPQDYDKVDADDYIFHEDNERIFFLIKSKADEYCFTNLALIHLDGTSAMSKKRILNRLPYGQYRISHVLLETAGTVDLDVEIKFTIGDKDYSIDVNKKQIETLKDLYKALHKISEIQRHNATLHGYAQQSLELASNTIGRFSKTELDLTQSFQDLAKQNFEWLSQAKANYMRSDFERYINQ